MEVRWRFTVKLADLVKKNLKRAEILDFMNRDFSQYAWSLGTEQ